MYDGVMNADEMMQFVTPDLDPRKNADHLFIYKGIHCRQTRRVFNSLDALNAALADNRPKTIVEIGTFHGAFTTVLRDHDITNDTDVHTFDIKAFSSVKRLDNVTYHVGSCWETETMSVIQGLIQREGRSLVFCDGDNKEKEVRVFCTFLKPGDIILCHDYCKSKDVMKDPSIIGNWPPDQYESQWVNIQEALTANGCEPYMELEMQKSMWGCFIKKA